MRSPLKGKVLKPSKPKLPLPAATRGLVVEGGFDWSGNAPATMTETSDSSSDEDDAPVASTRSVKSQGKRRAVEDLTTSAADPRPESVTDFERALLASPNSSFLWIQYMSFQLQLHEIDKARRTGRQALGKIGFREEEEKLNIWMALINLELGFGTEESAEKVFEEAAEYNDTRTIYLRYTDALQEAGKEEVRKKLRQQD